MNEKKYTITAKNGSFITVESDGIYHYWTDVNDAPKFKLSEAFALKEQFPQDWKSMGLKIHEVVLTLGEEVSL